MLRSGGWSLACCCLSAALLGQAPVPLRTVCVQGPDQTPYLRDLKWEVGGAAWHARLRWRFLAPGSASGPQEPRVIGLTVEGPDHQTQSIANNLDLLSCMFGGPDPGGSSAPLYDYFGSDPIWPAQVWILSDWRVTRLTWAQVAGGNPPMPFLFVVEHRPSGRWMAQLVVGWNMPQPDRGAPVHLSVAQAERVRIAWWDQAGRRLAERRSVSVAWDGTQLTRLVHPSQYSLFTRTGAVATWADTPAEAIHAGFQEVSWYIASHTPRGGVAESFADSPRTFVDKEDRTGAPVLPARSLRLPFEWSRDLYVVPWGHRPRRVLLPEGLKLVASGGWEVVLFPRPGGTALATRLIQRRMDFEHSRPPQPGSPR